ncbi:MAG: hypothetical protein WBA61_14305 [Aequorivita sp.]
MKISRIILLFSLAISMLGCSKDDGPDPIPPYTLSTANFPGTYAMNFLELKVEETITFSNGSTSTSTSTKVGSVFQDVKYVFNTNNTFTADGLYNSVETIRHPDGTTEVKPIVIVALDKTGSFTLKPTQGTLILIDQDNITNVYEIKKYTPTEMWLYSEDVATNGNSTVVTTQDVRFSR